MKENNVVVKKKILFCTSGCGVFSYRSSEEAVKGCIKRHTRFDEKLISLPDIESDCLASLELFCLYKQSL